MFEKNSLFYAANIEPEMARMFVAFDSGKVTVAENFKKRIEDMITKILSLNEIGPAGREEWFALRNLVSGYQLLDQDSRAILLSFGKPFSQKFARQLV